MLIIAAIIIAIPLFCIGCELNTHNKYLEKSLNYQQRTYMLNKLQYDMEYEYMQAKKREVNNNDFY